MANKQIKHLMLKLLGQDTEEVMDIYDEKAVHIYGDVTKVDIGKDANSNNYKVTWYTQDSPAKGRTLLLNNDGGLFRTFDYSSGSLVTNTHWELAKKDKVVRKEGSLLTDTYLRKSTSETERYEIVFKTNGNTGAQLIMRDNGLVYQRFENGTYSTKWNAIPTSKIVNNLTSTDATTVLSGAQGKALQDQFDKLGSFLQTLDFSTTGKKTSVQTAATIANYTYILVVGIYNEQIMCSTLVPRVLAASNANRRHIYVSFEGGTKRYGDITFTDGNLTSATCGSISGLSTIRVWMIR